MIFEKGIADLPSSTKSYSVWHSMIRRCYSKNYQKDKPTYKNVEVINDWLLLSNFDNWFNHNYIENWQLDKDLLSNFGKIYSKDTCCFLPNEVNCALKFDTGKNGLYPGVSIKTASMKYISQYSRNVDGKRKSIHLLSSDDPYKCFLAYKKAKEGYLKELADKYSTILPVKVYNKLVNLQVQESYKS